MPDRQGSPGDEDVRSWLLVPGVVVPNLRERGFQRVDGTFLVENVPSAVEPDATRDVADLLLQHVGTQLRTKRVRGNSSSVAH